MIRIQACLCSAACCREGMMFPYDFGFIPSTLGEDGDPLDILVLMDAPAHVGCLIEVRIIGIIEAEQSEDGKTESNDRILGVAIHSYDHQDWRWYQSAEPFLRRNPVDERVRPRS